MSSSRIVAAAFVLGFFLPHVVAAQPPAHGGAPAAGAPVALADTARVRKWREDVRFITGQVRRFHPRPFTHCPEASFDSAARAIEARIPTTDDSHLAVECMKLMALLRDGHSAVVGTFPPLGFTSVLPLAMRPFADGTYVVAADPAYASVVGAKVTKVGDVSTDEALARIATVTNADNHLTELDRAPLFLMMPALLQVLGISREHDAVAIEVERAGGKRETVKVAGGGPPEGFPFAYLETEPGYPTSWASARKVDPAKMPRMDRRPGDAWWFEYLPESKLVYLRMKQVQPVSNGIVYLEFYRQLFFTVDSLKPRALVIDLRHDHGGNNTILDPLIRGIIERPWLDREGSLFALIDRGTFSAAMNAAVFLDDRTDARFVGEPTGGRVNHYGDARQGQTPNFEMLCNVSTVPWLARFPQDTRPWIAPEIAVPWTFAAWRDGKDEPLDAAIDAAWNGTLPLRVLEAAKRGGAKAGKDAWDAWRKEHPNPWMSDFTSMLVTYGADLADRRQWRDAATLEEATTLIDPKATLAWRVLGEAQMHLGDRAGAVASLRKALELNPNAQMARLLLQRLGEKVE